MIHGASRCIPRLGKCSTLDDNEDMKPAHLLMMLLVVANLLILIAWTARWQDATAQWEDYADGIEAIFVHLVVLQSLAMGHVGLLAIWLGLGRAPTSIRLIGVSLDAIVLHFAAEIWQLPHDIPSAAIVIYTILASLPFLLMRGLGMKLIRTDDPEPASDDKAGQNGFQFSLRTIFAWTTAVAVFLSMIATVGDFRQIPKDTLNAIWGRPEEVLMVFLPSVMTLWAVLGMKRFKLRLFLLIPLPSLVSFLYLSARSMDFGFGEFWMYLCLPQNLVLLLSLAVCRVAGYRVAWSRPRWSRVVQEDVQESAACIAVPQELE